MDYLLLKTDELKSRLFRMSLLKQNLHIGIFFFFAYSVSLFLSIPSRKVRICNRTTDKKTDQYFCYLTAKKRSSVADIR